MKKFDKEVELIDMYLKEISIKEISKFFSINIGTIYNVINRNNIKLRHIQKFNEAKIIAEEKTAQRKRLQTTEKEKLKKIRSEKPKITSPGIDGDLTKLMQSMQKWRDTGRWAKGGSVNLKKKQYKTVINKFSDRMLPGKKRTTRIY